MDHINQRDRIILIILSAVFIALAAFVLGNKTNLHGDEVFTYGLSNHPYIHTFNIKAEEGTVYTPADILWNEYMQVQPGHQFDYRNVWKNQEADVHPPLYYALVHTISSFFPGRYSVWFAGSVNVVFGVLLILCVFFFPWRFSGKRRMPLSQRYSLCVRQGCFPPFLTCGCILWQCSGAALSHILLSDIFVREEQKSFTGGSMQLPHWEF